MVAINILMIILIVVVSAILLKDLYFSVVCLTKAIKSKQIGVNRHNYLRWEMPNNDIENQIEDEIKVNTLFICSIVLWVLTLMLYPKSLLVVYAIYGLIVLYHIKMNKSLEKRYSDYYEVFSTKDKREDFSDNLVIYGLRIEGTLTKLKKVYVLSVFYIIIGVLLTIV